VQCCARHTGQIHGEKFMQHRLAVRLEGEKQAGNLLLEAHVALEDGLVRGHGRRSAAVMGRGGRGSGAAAFA